MTYQSIYYSVNLWIIILSMLMLVYCAMDMIIDKCKKYIKRTSQERKNKLKSILLRKHKVEEVLKKYL